MQAISCTRVELMKNHFEELCKNKLCQENVLFEEKSSKYDKSASNKYRNKNNRDSRSQFNNNYLKNNMANRDRQLNNNASKIGAKKIRNDNSNSANEENCEPLRKGNIKRRPAFRCDKTLKTMEHTEPNKNLKDKIKFFEETRKDCATESIHKSVYKTNNLNVGIGKDQKVDSPRNGDIKCALTKNFNSNSKVQKLTNESKNGDVKNTIANNMNVGTSKFQNLSKNSEIKNTVANNLIYGKSEECSKNADAKITSNKVPQKAQIKSTASFNTVYNNIVGKKLAENSEGNYSQESSISPKKCDSSYKVTLVKKDSYDVRERMSKNEAIENISRNIKKAIDSKNESSIKDRILCLENSDKNQNENDRFKHFTMAKEKSFLYRQTENATTENSIRDKSKINKINHDEMENNNNNDEEIEMIVSEMERKIPEYAQVIKKKTGKNITNPINTDVSAAEPSTNKSEGGCEDITYAIKKVLQSPLPKGPPPKKPPRTFAHPTLSQQNSASSTDTKTKPNRVKSDPKLMLEKLENALLNQKIKSPPIKSVSTNYEKQKNVESPFRKTDDSHHSNRRLQPLLNCFPMGCTQSAYAALDNRQSEFFINELRNRTDPIYAEPFGSQNGVETVSTNDMSSFRRKSIDSDKRSESSNTTDLHYMCTLVADITERRDQ